METREQLLRRFVSLKERARKLANRNKHQLEPIERLRTVGYSKCLACGDDLWVKLFPKTNEPEISGTAVKNLCRNPL